MPTRMPTLTYGWARFRFTLMSPTRPWYYKVMMTNSRVYHYRTEGRDTVVLVYMISHKLKPNQQVHESLALTLRTLGHILKKKLFG